MTTLPKSPAVCAPQGDTKPKACGGCGKPFNALRKPRERAMNVFVSLEPSSYGRTGFVPVTLCGACRRLVNGGTPFNLPALDRSAEDLERLVLADPTGPLQ
ncbi:MAG: hypothetical protein QM702_25215 [Rubrivivax sp.]